MRNKANKNKEKGCVNGVSVVHGETPPNIREKLAEAAKGRFSIGDRSNISRIKSALK
jgi:hypothetical protein